jgi:hypothetical protein
LQAEFDHWAVQAGPRDNQLLGKIELLEEQIAAEQPAG